MILGRHKGLGFKQPGHAFKDLRPLQYHLREDTERNHQHLELCVFVCLCVSERAGAISRMHESMCESTSKSVPQVSEEPQTFVR